MQSRIINVLILIAGTQGLAIKGSGGCVAPGARSVWEEWEQLEWSSGGYRRETCEADGKYLSGDWEGYYYCQEYEGAVGDMKCKGNTEWIYDVNWDVKGCKCKTVQVGNWSGEVCDPTCDRPSWFNVGDKQCLF